MLLTKNNLEPNCLKNQAVWTIKPAYYFALSQTQLFSLAEK